MPGATKKSAGPDFSVTPSAPNPASINPGQSASVTVTINSIAGFNGSVALSCTASPGGATCSFNPSSLSGGSGTSTLTVSTSATTGIGTYPVSVVGTSGSLVHGSSIKLVIQMSPSFSIGPANGSPASATVSAGASALFNLAIVPAAGWRGTVNLTCAVTPAGTKEPVCGVPASVNVPLGTAAVVMVKVSTTAPRTAGSISRANLPSGMLPICLTIVLLASGLLCAGYRRQKPALATLMVAMAFLTMPGRGGSSSPTTTPGTPREHTRRGSPPSREARALAPPSQ